MLRYTAPTYTDIALITPMFINFAMFCISSSSVKPNAICNRDAASIYIFVFFPPILHHIYTSTSGSSIFSFLSSCTPCSFGLVLVLSVCWFLSLAALRLINFHHLQVHTQFGLVTWFGVWIWTVVSSDERLYIFPKN